MSTPIIPAQKRNDADTTSSRPTADPAVGPSTTPMPQRVLDPAPEPRNRFGLSGAQVAGSALAATTSAVAASGLGVAGTLLGAALGSVVITVGGAVYAHTFRSARRRIVTIIPTTVRAPQVTRPGEVATTPPQAAGQATGAAYVVGGPAPVEAARAARRWRAVATVLAGLLLALGAITVVEVVLGHPIGDSSRSGTTITDTVTHEGSARARVEPAPAPGQQSDPTPAPSTSSEPTPSATSTTPTPTASPTPSDAPTPTPTSTPDPGTTSTPGP